MSEDFQSYPYSGNDITLSDAVIFICAVVYPQVARDKAEKLKARKRVRERICQAGKDGIFRIFEKKRGKTILANELFNWAVECKGWDKLYGIHGLPRTISATAQLRVPGFAVEAFAIAIPGGEPDLERQFKDTAIKLMKKECEIDQLRLENDTLRAEVKKKRAKEDAISKTRSESAKKPRPR